MDDAPRFTCRALLLLPLLLGCAAETHAGTVEAVQSNCGPIVGGHVDAGHLGVVALLDEGGNLACSGSLIGDVGGAIVLTAAHCLGEPIAGAVLGSDYTAPERFLPAQSQFPHPDFDRHTGAFDFGTVVLDGHVEATSWVALPSAADDGLAAGTRVDFVGYGTTNSATPNTKRREVAGTVDAVTSLSFDYAQDAGGPCSGDSGGPALADIDGRSVLVGVTSSGDETCRVNGTSARVSAGLDFVTAALGGEIPLIGCGHE
jgi:secreted trypsin-like serine protease